MQHELVAQILEHPTPERLRQEVAATLAAEKEARAAFRQWLKPDVKAEFINGEIVMHSPAKRRHNQATHCINTLLGFYTSTQNLGEVSVEIALVGLTRHDVEPDVCFWRTKTSDGFTDDMDVYPPPDLVVEVLSKSTVGGYFADTNSPADREGGGVIEALLDAYLNPLSASAKAFG